MIVPLLLLTLRSVEVPQAHGTVMEPLHPPRLTGAAEVPAAPGPPSAVVELPPGIPGEQGTHLRGSGDSTFRSLDIT